ncbi:WhiB family transcriptional regulator [Nonomuraea sp. NPDC050643]|uniref:WhiB family transcriptional regulator n=1 Tax=Nonomuraea sp. NPDC050643 TaxID=3155660 RepID=UPI0033C86204
MAGVEWSWQRDAACRGEDLHLFFGRDGEKYGARMVREQKAIAICEGCPVVRSCLLAAFERKEDTGVWGGLGEAERALRRRSWLRSAAYGKRADSQTVNTPADKRCAGCGTTKPAADFPKDRRQTDGLNRTCKECANKAGKANRDRQRAAAQAVA